MTDARWDRAKEIFQEALERTGADRAAFVAAACGDDAALRAQVEGLLAAHEQAGAFMASPTGGGAAADPGAATRATAPAHEPVGTRVGPYKLLQVIGEGGFGVVYMAEQEQPIRRRVALKIIKLGMDTKEVIARFEAERQALALMDHPNIAKVLDAGATESGRPYFVMELVKGVPITDYCDASHLTTRERLDLFADVCKGIHHAHERGIIHRDIKPSNVLVTLHDGTPVPKIIDFGVAKATNQRLTEKTLFTAFGEFVGTPAYMSPEQTEMSGLEIDRRSDVYALGVLLYELLTGTTPFEAEAMRARAFLEVLRIIREDDPPTPSARLHTLGNRLIEVAGRRQVEPAALQKLVRGDLDRIVMKALEKDRRRRYDSASALVDDLTRYFRDEPVVARRPSAGYRFTKFARRRRGKLLAASAIVVAILLGGALAQFAGFLPGAATVSAAPARRLVLDEAGQWDNANIPTHDGRHLLRYDVLRRGYELVNIESKRSRLLTSGGPEASARSFVDHSLAPNQRTIAAVHRISRDAQQERAPDNDGGMELRLFRVGGSGEGRLLSQWGPKHRVYVFGWSADQSVVWVFVMRPDRTAEIAAVSVTDGSRRVLKTLAFRNHTQTPSLSPDGTLIAYHDEAPKILPGIILVAADGSREMRLEQPAGTADVMPMFTPDGSGLVFRSTRKGGDLWFLPLANGRPAGEPRAVWAKIGPYGQAMVFAENGSLIYFFATNGWEIYTADVALDRGGDAVPERVQPRPGEMNNAPAYSPDGRFLAHLRGGRRLVLRELTTGAEREFPLDVGSLGVATLDYCPDGRTVLVTGFDGRNPTTFAVNVDRGGAERLPVISSRAVCLKDGRDVVYLEHESKQGSRSVVRRSLATGLETTLYGGPILQPHLARSKDGSHIAFVAMGTNDARLLVMPSTGGEAATVASSPLAPGSWTLRSEFVGLMWLTAGNELLVCRRTGGKDAADASPEVTFSRVPVDGRPGRQVGQMRLPAYANGFYGSWNYSLHPNGSHIAFERHSGLVNQYWAIDNLMQFIRSGTSIAEPDTPR